LQTLAQLLKEAENHFRAKRYLTPVNQNAYSVYQAVLALEPQHRLALQRIEQIKLFYSIVCHFSELNRSNCFIVSLVKNILRINDGIKPSPF
jgi:hypothetical protein